MRSKLLALLACLGFALPAWAQDLRYFDDAMLHAVQFLDDKEGWAVGDEGVIWHTLDGGKHWERQPTGVRASLRSLHFLTPSHGWVVGREELPNAGGSSGVILFTEDGGLSWKQSTHGSMPGLNKIRFVDQTLGYVVGDATAQYPTGVFQTTDARSWRAVPGPRCSSWLSADFTDAQNGALAGTWNRLAILRDGKLIKAEIDGLGGRSVHAVQLQGLHGIAVGEGGLILLSDFSKGSTWSLPDVKLPRSVLSQLDFSTVSAVGTHLWVAGRPGSVVLHSPDRGNTWEVQRTGQPLPLRSLHFVTEQSGWAVGALGTILHTQNGGKTWVAQKQGGLRSAAMVIQAQSQDLPLTSLAQLGAEEGYLLTALRIVSHDPESSPLTLSSAGQRYAQAVRFAGGAAGESLWQFPQALHQQRLSKTDLVQAWNKLHADQAPEQLLQQIVLALRIWQPDLILTDSDDEASNSPAASLVVEALGEAYRRAGDPACYPEHMQVFGLTPAKVKKIYCTTSPQAAHELIDGSRLSKRLQNSLNDWTLPANGLLGEGDRKQPAQRGYRLTHASRETNRVGQLETHPEAKFFAGLVLAPGGSARRKLSEPAELSPELEKALRAKRTLTTLVETPLPALNEPNRVLSQLEAALQGLPSDQAAPAAYGIAQHYVRQGQWMLARETFSLMTKNYPSHPLTADACRWLIRHNTSSEAKHRYERGHFFLIEQVKHQTTIQEKVTPGSGKKTPVLPEVIRTDLQVEQVKAGLSNDAETRQWFESALALEPRLAAFGRLFGQEPSAQFCLHAARRTLGDFESARRWYTRFAQEQVEGPYRDAAAAELWLQNRSTSPPKPVLSCYPTQTKPFLDGKLDDPCWSASRPIVLRNAVGKTLVEGKNKDGIGNDSYKTEAWLCYDADFLYVAVRCQHPKEYGTEPTKTRKRDEDLAQYDRVSLLLDLDRDYATSFNLHIDQRGCVADDCWGDSTWNPRWFVAVQHEPTAWQAELAIPLNELTYHSVNPTTVWAVNLVRTLPGRGVQAFSLPADAQPRPEGLGLLLFGKEAAPLTNPGTLPKLAMPRVP